MSHQNREPFPVRRRVCPWRFKLLLIISSWEKLISNLKRVCIVEILRRRRRVWFASDHQQHQSYSKDRGMNIHRVIRLPGRIIRYGGLFCLIFRENGPDRRGFSRLEVCQFAPDQTSNVIYSVFVVTKLGKLGNYQLFLKSLTKLFKSKNFRASPN